MLNGEQLRTHDPDHRLAHRRQLDARDRRGVPVPPGNTLLERREALWCRDDGLRRMLNFEPRGHGMMCSVLLMPPIGDADFSIIIMEQDEYAATLDGP